MAEPSEAAAPQRKLKHVDLTNGPIAPVLLSFSIPVLGASALQSLNGSINAIWVGRLLGEAALTATTNANLILFMLLGCVFGFGMAATILVGQAYGARDQVLLKRVIGTMATFFVGASCVSAALGFLFTDRILAAMGTPHVALQMAKDYLQVTFLAVPFLFLFNYLMMTLRGAGDARTPFRFMALAAVLDVIFNPLLILGVGPFPQMGIAGAAMSMLISQGIGFALMLAYLYRRKSDVRLTRDELHYLKPDREILTSAITKGIPMGLQMIVISLSSLIMMTMINAYGAGTGAAFGVAMQIWTYVQMPAMSIAAAVSSMAAQNVGAGKWDRVEATARAGVIINVLLTGALVIVLYIVDPYVVGLFLPGQAEAIATAEHINNISGWSFIAFGVTFVLFGVIRSTGASTPPLIILFISLFVVRLGFVHLFEGVLGADAIWWSFPVSMMSSMLMAIGYYRWGKWRSATMLRVRGPQAVEGAPVTGMGAPAIDALAANEDADVEAPPLPR